MFGLSFFEIGLALVVGLLLFGGDLPKVAAEAAKIFVQAKRKLTDLRRETGIDREIQNAKRMLEDSVPEDVRSFDARREWSRTVAEPVKQVLREAEASVAAASSAGGPEPQAPSTPPVARGSIEAEPADPAVAPPAESPPTSAQRDEAAG